MIPSPYRFEPTFTDAEYAKLGVLALRWSHIEHILGNCLKVLLRLTDEEAIVIVFPMRRMRIRPITGRARCSGNDTNQRTP